MKITVGVSKPLQSKEVDSRWEELKMRNVIEGRSCFGWCVQAETVYLHGGYNVDHGILSDFYQLRLTQPYEHRQWVPMLEQGALNQMKLRNHSLAAYKYYILCVGGQKNMMDNNNTIYKYDLRIHEWSQCNIKSQLPEGEVNRLLSRDSHICFIQNASMYVFGGYLSSGNYTNTMLKCSLSQINEQITMESIHFQIAPLPRASVGWCVHQDELYIFGGTCSLRNYHDFWQFHLPNQKWEEISPSDGHWPESRKGCSLAYHEVTGSIFLFGGLQQITKEKNDVCIYVKERKKWVTVHHHTNNLYEPSPTIKKQMEDSPTVIQCKRKKQKRKQKTMGEVGLMTKYYDKGSRHEKKEQKKAMNKTFSGWHEEKKVEKQKVVRPVMSVVAEKKQREFLNKKKKFLSEVNSTKISPHRALSPTSESIQYRLSRIGFQKPTQEINRYDYPPVVYDEEKGVVIGKKPCARDGHACFVIDNNMHILGGDRHMVSFNDCHIFRMDKALESVIHYSN